MNGQVPLFETGPRLAVLNRHPLMARNCQKMELLDRSGNRPALRRSFDIVPLSQTKNAGYLKNLQVTRSLLVDGNLLSNTWAYALNKLALVNCSTGTKTCLMS